MSEPAWYFFEEGILWFFAVLREDFAPGTDYLTEVLLFSTYLFVYFLLRKALEPRFPKLMATVHALGILFYMLTLVTVSHAYSMKLSKDVAPIIPFLFSVYVMDALSVYAENGALKARNLWVRPL